MVQCALSSFFTAFIYRVSFFTGTPPKKRVWVVQYMLHVFHCAPFILSTLSFIRKRSSVHSSFIFQCIYIVSNPLVKKNCSVHALCFNAINLYRGPFLLSESGLYCLTLSTHIGDSLIKAKPKSGQCQHVKFLSLTIDNIVFYMGCNFVLSYIIS